ncbi:MAG: GDSL-type esterase/lipase family protein [Myxococcales bacterium]|nr:GDSL-type esterase/lipase family protein [Myxococcales bacterium]
MNRHPTAWTIALLILFAVALSLLPIPESLRPLAFQKNGVGPTLLAVLFPQHKHQTLAEARHAHLDEPTTQQPTTLTDLLTVPSASLEPVASARSDELGAPAHVAVGGGGGGGGEPESLDEAAVSPEIQNAPGFWLRTNSAPTLAWLSAGAKAFGEFRRIEALAQQLNASHRDIEEGCLDAPELDTDTDSGATDRSCRRRALDPFFDALAEIERGVRSEPVRIAHIGNSLIASDYVAGTIRAQLSERYGAGGIGFLFVDRPTRISGSFDRTGKASAGWQIALLTDKGDRSRHGMGGARFTSKEGSTESVRFDLKGSQRADIAWLARPDGGAIDVAIDGQRQAQPIETRGALGTPAFSRIELPRGAKTLTLTTRGGPVELFGVTLENGKPGIVHDTYGLAGGTAQVFLQADEAIFGAQLQARDPALVLIMLGGNEAYEMSRGWMKLDTTRKTIAAFIDRVRGQVPDAACLVTSPLDAGIRTADGNIQPRPFTDDVRTLLREAALERGCAFWDMLDAMGGVGAAARWFEAKVMSEDLVHPRAKGAEVLGHLLVTALERARLIRDSSRADLLADPPGIGAPERLTRFFDKLSELDAGIRRSPVNVAQIGASHTAAHFFTDAARARLSKKFGGAGRGFVAAGASSKRLRNAGVERERIGTWEILDARERPAGEPWGLTGIRAMGQPGARHVWRFGLDDIPSKDKGTLCLYFLDRPGVTGHIEVKIDGAPPLELPLGTVEAMTARAERWEVDGPKHTLEITLHGNDDTPLSIFGAALDLDKPGIRWDALGLPGSTAILADGYDKDVYSAQLATRQADLLVLFYGTNEAALPDLDGEALRQRYGSLLDTLRAASPDADCLILGPTDRLDPKQGAFALAPSMDLANQTIREIAREKGCAFWSTRRAMGGTRAMLRWQETTPPLGHADGVHLTPKGYQVLSNALTDALLDEWQAHRQRQGVAANEESRHME